MSTTLPAARAPITARAPPAPDDAEVRALRECVRGDVPVDFDCVRDDLLPYFYARFHLDDEPLWRELLRCRYHGAPLFEDQKVLWSRESLRPDRVGRDYVLGSDPFARSKAYGVFRRQRLRGLFDDDDDDPGPPPPVSRRHIEAYMAFHTRRHERLGLFVLRSIQRNLLVKRHGRSYVDLGPFYVQYPVWRSVSEREIHERRQKRARRLGLGPEGGRRLGAGAAVSPASLLLNRLHRERCDRRPDFRRERLPAPPDARAPEPAAPAPHPRERPTLLVRLRKRRPPGEGLFEGAEPPGAVDEVEHNHRRLTRFWEDRTPYFLTEDVARALGLAGPHCVRSIVSVMRTQHRRTGRPFPETSPVTPHLARLIRARRLPGKSEAALLRTKCIGPALFELVLRHQAGAAPPES